MDGATVLLHDGTILAVGAILRIDGGNAGGGRTAAAMELAKLGAGIKISNDGKISYWMDLYRRNRSRQYPPQIRNRLDGFRSINRLAVVFPPGISVQNIYSYVVNPFKSL